ncbi:hypothetical protein [Confluentibacter lentus]|uniref:hypothetical protein n=1 Tax=Confluentibacter lentus TaxID=1699412 RepID=UPI000BD94B69|nr:hypothetical protein [Confluentibacter lentus]OYX23970.1 MAG: hypothetical protein B7Z06_09495 [Flavobacteriales bacterium 32-35-8]
METAVFKSYENGYYTFLFDNGEDMVFEEVHPRVLKQFDLKNDSSLVGKEFRVSFVEVFDDGDEDFLIYRIESLKPL